MTNEPLKIVPDGERRCVCVKRHTPEPRELHRHHIWPLGHGGPDIASNLRWLCLPGEMPVTLADGTLRSIADVRIGDVVFGHDGFPHHVTGTTVSGSTEDIVRLDDLLLTADHLVFTPSGWLPAGCLRKGDEVCRLEPFGERVQTHVLSLVDAEPQILGPIVVRDQVDVMHDLSSTEFTPNDLFHDKPCPLHLPTVVAVPHDEDDVPFVVEPPVTPPLGGPRDALESSEAAIVTTELSSARTLVSTQSEHGPALQTRLSDRRHASIGRGAPVRAGGVPASVRRRVLEVLTTSHTRLDSEVNLTPSHRRWDSLSHVERAPHDGYLYDITIAGSQSFVAGGIAVHNCPTTHMNVHQLWRIYDACNGQVGGAILNRYNKYVRELVADGWNQAQAATSPSA